MRPSPPIWRTSQRSAVQGRGKRPERRRTQRGRSSIAPRSTSAPAILVWRSWTTRIGFPGRRSERASGDSVERRVAATLGRDPEVADADDAVLRWHLGERSRQAPVLRDQASGEDTRDDERTGGDAESGERDPLEPIGQTDAGVAEREEKAPERQHRSGYWPAAGLSTRRATLSGSAKIEARLGRTA
jgi:hypothetical protein